MDPTTIPLDALTKKHPERQQWEPRWADYRLAYRGGYEFLRAAGQSSNTTYSNTATSPIVSGVVPVSPVRRFLWQLDGEPDPKYRRRWERASYVNYLAAIIDFFRHWLYSQPPQIRPADSKEVPDWWSDFYGDASGGGLSLIDVARESFLDVLLYRRAGWLIGLADGVAKPGEDDKVVLTSYSANEILDWQCNPRGDLEWVTLCKEQTIREFPDDRIKVEVITYVDRAQWHAWEVRNDEHGKPQASYLGGAEHALGEVPFVLREIPHGLWIADKLFAPCMSLFNRTAMLEYAEHVGCFIQPFIKSAEQDAESRILGEGILLHLRPGDGQREAEDYGWKSPDISPMNHLAERLRQDRDEIYRSVHQMSLAVDSQAVGAIARSGASKIEDRRATETILAGYGRYELRALVKTANLISKVYGDKLEWVGDGFENFQTSTLDEELQIAALAQAFNIKSPTFNAELQRMIATGRVLPHLDEGTKQKIENEIKEANEEPPEEAVQVLGPDGKPMPPDGEEPPEDEQESDAEAGQGESPFPPKKPPVE